MMGRRRGSEASRSLLEDDEDDGGEEEARITVNQDYAKRFVHNKKREDLHRLQELEKQGRAGGSDESDSEEEDDEGLLPVRTDAQIFETLSKIKRRDPDIYEPGATFYDDVDEEEEEGDGEGEHAEKKKPLYLKDVVAQHLLDGGDDEDERPRRRAAPPRTYADEQKELKDAFLRSAAEADSDDEGGLLRVRHKTQEELVRDKEDDEAAVQEAEQRKKDVDIARRLESYFGKDDGLDENEKFLKDYLLNQGWIDRDLNRTPSYQEVVGEVSEEEDDLDKQDKYEAEFNFRFQEGGVAQVMGHSRMVEGSVRKKPDARKKQRMKKEERILEEAKLRQEELKRLKNLKKKELMEKLEKIRTVAGASSGGLSVLDEEDLEEDFDPDEYDKKMKKAFGEDYYGAEDAELDEDENMDIIEKPNFEDEDEALGLPKDSDKKVGFAAVHEKQKISSKEKFAFDKRLEDYYKLDYEDMVGDLPTRFKYRQINPSNYGLKVKEILNTDDKDLNQIVSIKKLAPYRTEEWEVPRHLRLSQKGRKKQALNQEQSFSKAKAAKNRLHSSHAKGEASAPSKLEPGTSVSEGDQPKETGATTTDGNEVRAEVVKKSKKRRRKKSGPAAFLDQSRLASYGVTKSSTKKRKRHATE